MSARTLKPRERRHETPQFFEPIYERLGVTSTQEIWIEAPDRVRGKMMFVARSRSAMVRVDRPLALRLRTSGAAWRGDITRDPCPVA